MPQLFHNNKLFFINDDARLTFLFGCNFFDECAKNLNKEAIEKVWAHFLKFSVLVLVSCHILYFDTF